MKKGRTHDFGKLRKVLWAATGEKIPHPETYQRMQETRNAVQHFCVDENDGSFRRLSLEFIYNVIDPLIYKHFDLYAIEFHEDHCIGYDYVVGCLLRHEIKFTMPPDYRVGEIDPEHEMRDASVEYRHWYDNCVNAL